MKNKDKTNSIKFGTALLLSLVFGAMAFAQSLSGPLSAAPNSTQTYTYNDGTAYFFSNWQVAGGSVVATSQSGTAYSAIITWGAVGSGTLSFRDKTLTIESISVIIEDQAYPTAVLSDLNYVHSVTPRTATTDIGTLDNEDRIESVTYFDGLGRASQQVGIRAGGNRSDIVTHMDYDALGRQVKEYLPYTTTANIGSFRSNALAQTNSYYDHSSYDEDFPGMTTVDINPYSEKELESSPLSRVLKQAAPGKDWKLGNGKEIEMAYLVNTATEVRRYDVALAKNVTHHVVTYIPTLSSNGHYAAGELYKSVTKDENHTGTGTDHTTEEFKNKEGQVLLKRTYENNVAHDTYYVYDDYGNLSFVLPPKAEAHTATPNSSTQDDLCYQYRYDDRNRLVEKKIPGKGWEYIVYNTLDQPVMTQDANLRAQNQWLVTKYDAFGRVAYTGLKNANNSRYHFQRLINLDADQYEERASSGTGYLNTYYTSNVHPETLDEIHTVNYYDDYNFDLDGGTSETAYGVTPTTNVKSLATGSKVRVLGTSDWITTVTYYDAKARPIYVYAKNDYLGTRDKVKSLLAFDGRVTETTSQHGREVNGNWNGYSLTVVDKYSYDHANRLLTHRQKINNAALDEIIVANAYDDLGRLNDKSVGGKENAPEPLQKVDYGYNVRGWLKTINDTKDLQDDLFAFRINYNTPAYLGTALYNGNISETEWATANDGVIRWYSYSYDALNRLKSADFNNDRNDQVDWFNVSNITYDKNGNILTLHRNKGDGPQAGQFMDKLAYTYDAGNRLLMVEEDYDGKGSFEDGTNTGNDYYYDANGNMETDLNKGIARIDYNHLNLPTKVFLPNGDIEYIYDATGIKQQKIVSTGTTTDYAGNYIYENGNFKIMSHPEGYAEIGGNSSKVPVFNYAYQYKDHLGNIRLTYADSDGDGQISASAEIIEENNYYPFGLKHKGYNDIVSANVNSVASRFKFGGKEFNDELGLDWYDVSARNYDPALGRWMNLDPLAEDMRRHSPYNYAFDNPVYYIDPDGMMPIDPKKIWRALTQPGRILKRFRAYSQGVKDGMSSELQYDTYRQTENENKTPGKTYVAEADHYEYDSGYDTGKFIQQAIEFVAGSGGPSNIRRGLGVAKKLISKGAKNSTRTKVSAKAVNKTFTDSGKNAPYNEAYDVVEGTIKEGGGSLVRVHGEGNKAGKWMMDASEIKGLSAKQIQDKFALPELPTQISDVSLPTGTKIRVGVAGKVEGWGNGGGVQVEVLERLSEDIFTNTRKLKQ